MLANPSAAPGDDGDFPRPVIVGAGPVAELLATQKIVDAARKAKEEYGIHPAEKEQMLTSQAPAKLSAN